MYHRSFIRLHHLAHSNGVSVLNNFRPCFTTNMRCLTGASRPAIASRLANHLYVFSTNPPTHHALSSPQACIDSHHPRSFSLSAPDLARKSGANDDGARVAAQMKKRKIGAGLLCLGICCYFFTGPQEVKILTYLMSHLLIPFGLVLMVVSFL